MKKCKNTQKSIIIAVIFAVLSVFTCVSAFAETEPTEETYAIESFVEETTAPVEETQGSTASDPLESSTGEAESSTAPIETRPEPTYRESLPEVPPEDIIIPDVIGEVKEENEPALFWGFVAWICIGVGIAVVLAVLLTTKTKAYRAGGKKRYSTGDKISGKKRLLSDNYYHNSKRK